ncbi:MAG: acetate kinase [Leptothrix sp. (in: Bacteria)]|nr:acetate kinase [Leptothrix sp. (in: b-proteobacteria)]
MAILAVNAGSSTLKFALYPRRGREVGAPLLDGCIQGLEPGGRPRMAWTWQGQARTQSLPPVPGDTFTHALQQLAGLLAGLPGLPALPALEAVAHRVVHGGADFSASVIVTDAVLEQLARLGPLAPLHQPQNLQGIRAFRQAFPGLPQVACFDTAFHATLPELELRFALPRTLWAEGVRRYGFHGLSYQFLMQTLQQHSARAGGRVLMAHLGNGASLCAALQGRSVASSMGFSALDGLMMGTRCGALDPGVLLYLLAQGWTQERLQTLLYKESGLLGVSGVSADMRRLRADGSAQARFAIDLFTHRLLREAGAMAACLQGLDLLAFTGGIGEHDALLRADIGRQLAWLGVHIDDAANTAAVGDAVCAIHAEHSAVEVWVVPTDEGGVAARDAAALLG